MENWPALTGVAALAFFCDRLLLWMGERGWIYWRERAPGRRLAWREPVTVAPLETPRRALRDDARAARPPRRRPHRLGGRGRPRA
jgi:hypothetical protein